MKIGLAKEVITPSLPCFLAGFAGERKSYSVLDDLYVRLVVIEVEGSYYGVINYDLVAIDHLIIDKLKTGMEKMNLNIAHFLVTATHTHSGPGGIVESDGGIIKGTEYIFRPIDSIQINHIVEHTLHALSTAIEDRKEGTIQISRSVLHGIGKNRNNPLLKGNDDIFIASLKQKSGKQAVIINFACHPTVLDATNLQISADFPGTINNYLTDKGYYFASFLNGSCGDISTRFTRKESGYKETVRLGKIISDKVEAMIRESENCEIESIKSEMIDVKMKLKKPDTLEDAIAKVEEYDKKVAEAKLKGITGGELRTIESYYEGAMANLNYVKNAMNVPFYKVTIAIHRINDDYFVAIPGELFSELSNGLQNEHIHFICYANGYLGYFADIYAYENRFYEALSSPFEKGQSEELIIAIREKIKMLEMS